MNKDNTARSLQELPDLLARHAPAADDAPKPESKSDELLRLVREIHAAVTGAKPEKEPREPKRPRFAHLLVQFMEQGKVYIAETFMDYLKEKGVERDAEAIGSALIGLCQKGEIIRVRAGIYRLPHPADEGAAI